MKLPNSIYDEHHEDEGIYLKEYRYSSSEVLTLKEVEHALFTMYGRYSQQSKLISRFRNFQKLGVPIDRKPGRGARTGYTQEDVLQIMLCFELSQFGLSPTTVAHIICFLFDPKERDVPDIIHRSFLELSNTYSLALQTEVMQNDIYLLLYGNFMNEIDGGETPKRPLRLQLSTAKDFKKIVLSNVSHRASYINLNQLASSIYLSLCDAVKFRDEKAKRSRC